MKRKKWFMLLSVFCLCLLPQMAVKADTIYDSPYVTFSPNGKGWTVQAGDKHYTHYEEGTTVSTGIHSSLRPLKEGEHYYDSWERIGSIPIGKWVVRHKYAQCIHDVHMQKEEYLGLNFGRSNCYEYYHSGWVAYCADCGKKIKDMYVYMDKEAAKTIDYMDCRINLQYYHLCPHCNNLEQGVPMNPHICRQISWNQYRVEYKANDTNLSFPCSGFMNASIHMYNNATMYNGNAVLPATKLNRCTYSCVGYEFTGWNTEPDGSGRSFAEEEKILNLTSYDCNLDGELGVVTLYAQWKESESTLRIHPAGGSYDGNPEITSLTQGYMTQYFIDDSKVKAPEGATVCFETNGGLAVAPMTATMHFQEWMKEQPFKGRMNNKGVYFFDAKDGNIDTIKAGYLPDSILLPTTTKPNASFGGWYFDKEFTKPAGAPGDAFTPTEDVTLYAQWVTLTLFAEDNYMDNNQKGAVDLRWEQPDKKNKMYRLYQSRDAENWQEIYSAEEIGEAPAVEETFAYTGKTQTYTIPATGLYELTAAGAQGER